MKADLHIHTTASDGSWTPEELVTEVYKAGIKLFAVTDHDSVDSLATARRLAQEAGLFFLPGVEISSTLNGQSFHILGYGIEPEHKVLSQLLQHNAGLMEKTDHDSIKKLIHDGLAIDYAEYCGYTHNPARGGWKSLSFLIDKGLCKDVDDFFTNLFTPERGIFFPEFPPPAEVIAVIKAAGGVPVLAHPGSHFHGTVLDVTLDYFAGEDIGGVECFHPSHDPVTTRQALDWCQKHGLLITGGSDCHGNFVAQRCLGVPEIDLADLSLGKLAGSVK